VIFHRIAMSPDLSQKSQERLKNLSEFVDDESNVKKLM
jgi:hypothetical protein